MPTYNIVDQGADDTGGTAIDSVLSDLVGSNTTIVFPAGTYKLNELVVQSGTNNLELIAPDGARLVPGISGDNVRWFDVSGNGFVLDGFELDMRNTPIPPYVRMNSNAGNWELRRLITRGKVRAATDSNIGTNDSSDARTYFRLSSAEGTRGLMQDCYFQDGACAPNEASNRRAVLVESGSGELVFNRCWFELWAENTVYAKNPAGPMNIYSCFYRNTQNGFRLGGNTEVRNCVSIKDGQHPRQAWSDGSLQRGVNCEATIPTNLAGGIDSYSGTLLISDCDFYHRYESASCGGAITGQVTCQRIVVDDTRVSYLSTKDHDAIYTYDRQMSDGTPANLEYLELRNVDVRNDHKSEYAVFIGQVPDTWGTVSGVLGGTGPQTNSDYISSHMTINGNPTPPNTRPPLPEPPAFGTIPMQSAQLVRIDNSNGSSASTYRITAGADALPAGNDGATVTTSWGPNSGPRRPPYSSVATGTVPAGETYAFYVTGGIVSTEGSGPATWTVDGQPYNPGLTIATKTFRVDQPDPDTWHQAQTGLSGSTVVVAKPVSYNGVNPCHTRLRNVADGDFEYKLEEWAYLVNRSHNTETFSMLAVPPTEQNVSLDNGSAYSIKGGTASVGSDFVTVSFGRAFDSLPVVLTESQTFNNTDPLITRVSNVSTDSFAVRIQKEQALGSYTNETVGYIALKQGTGQLNGMPFEVRRTGSTVTNQWTHINFLQSYDSPRFIADMQTFNGRDPAGLRYRNLTGTGVDIKVEEEKSFDNETTHLAESVGYAVFEGSV